MWPLELCLKVIFLVGTFSTPLLAIIYVSILCVLVAKEEGEAVVDR